jgi:molybdate transport system ATP-binding protein
MIVITNASIMKAGKKLFQNLTFSVRDGEHWVITGANGSGKTLLLEVLAGTAHPATGEVYYDFISGATWEERYNQRRQKIHYIPAHAIQSFLQNYELFYQQRYYSIGDERIPKVKDLFGENLQRLHDLNLPESFNIEALLDLDVTRLSNGQLKKVLILRNMAGGMPRVLLCDYPFEGLDHVSRKDLTAFFDHLAQEFNITIILVDHEHHLPTVINRRLVLQDLRIVREEKVAPTDHDRITDAIPHNHNSPSTDAVVEMKNVTIRYGEKDVIKNFNWVINRGERWALTGKNGSGKTTLFSLIFADHPMAYSQHVYLFGKRRGSGESIWDIKRRINYLGPELINYLNPGSITHAARDYIRHQNKNITQEILEHAVAHFDAAHFIDKPVRTLSSGQTQLMLIISSIIAGKELLLLDEPFQFLDPAQKEKVSVYLQQHLQEHTTLVLITHYEQDMAHWTSRRMHIG